MDVKEAIEKCNLYIQVGAIINVVDKIDGEMAFVSYDTTAIETVVSRIIKNLKTDGYEDWEGMR